MEPTLINKRGEEYLFYITIILFVIIGSLIFISLNDKADKVCIDKGHNRSTDRNDLFFLNSIECDNEHIYTDCFTDEICSQNKWMEKIDCKKKIICPVKIITT